MTTLIVTPLVEELDALVCGLARHGAVAEERPVGLLPARFVPSLDLLVAHGGHGKAQFGVQTRYLLDHLRPPMQVLCVGAAGALVRELSIGDVVVATETHEHDYHLRFVRRPQPRFPGQPALLAQLRHVPEPASCAVRFGVMASDDEDVVDRERGIELCDRTGAIAVAWEGAGGARACALSETPFVELRGVTDTADHDAPAEFEANLGLAMANVAEFVWRWLRVGQSPYPSFAPPQTQP